MYGFAPAVPPNLGPSYSAPVINIWAFKVNGVSTSGVVGTGVTDVSFPTSNSKGNSLLDFLGDGSWGGVWYGLLADADWSDTPYANITGFQVGG